jgi:DNA helicase-2/ATP-dependent DNA helicase PcrA
MYKEYLPEYISGEQLEAVLHEGSPLLIIAGPGSGKTAVIIWRTVHLIRSGRVRPENLLVTTFTNKAADELQDRLVSQLSEVNVEAMQISTIHSFCAELLRRYRRQSPLPGGYRLLDEDAQLLFIYAERKALGLDDLIKGQPYSFFNSLISVFNLATEELVKPDKLLAWCEAQGEYCSEDESGLWQERHMVAEAYRRYTELLSENNLVDFAFLQKHTLTLLQENSGVLNELREHYQEILVDEYQDTNAAQEMLLGLLSGDGKRLTVVGDDDQSIYRFRGATVRNILSFTERYPGAHVVRLTSNFRSRKPIVDHSLRVIEHNPARYDKALHSTRGEGSDILLIYKDTVDEEVQSVVEQLQCLMDVGYISRWSDVAILLRSVKSYAGPYIDTLESKGIPFHVTGDASFFEREEISQFYNLFSFLSATKPWGDRFLRTPLVGLSKRSNVVLEGYKGDLANIASKSGLQSIGLEEERDIRKLLALEQLKAKVQAKEHNSLLDVFYKLLEAIDCVARFERSGEVEALANLGVMSRLIANWDSYGNSRNFYAFQRYIKLLREGGVDPFSLPPEEVVQVMTIHQAKGLEFPVVVLGAAMDGRLPTKARKDRYEIPYDMRASGEPEVEDTHLIDERKLFYVAVTRARDLLIIGTANKVKKRGGGPSPFVKEMFGKDLESAADLTQAKIEKVISAGEVERDIRKRFSYGELAYYQQCPMRYKFASVYGFEAPWMDPVGFGTNVHRVLEVIHQRVLEGHLAKEEDVAEIIAEVWISSRTVDEKMEKEFRDAALMQITRYLQENQETLDQVRGTEGYFEYPLEDYVLSGKFDLIRAANAEERVEVIDFKTSGFVHLETFGIDLQLDLYALGVERDLGKQVKERTVHFLRDGQVHSMEWTSERKESAVERLKTELGRVSMEDYTPNTKYCKHCDEFNLICPYSLHRDEGVVKE